MMDNEIMDALFSTHALRVCSADSPFWYTSGKLGPFYINTHFLFGSEEEACVFLDEIEKASADDRFMFPGILLKKLLAQYHKNLIFKMVIDKITVAAGKMDFDFISGGERRDFFFSILPAFFLKKPHLSIFKDREAVYSDSEFATTRLAESTDLKGKKALHIADLITEASSYTRAWLPVLRKYGAQIDKTIAVIDRKQGGDRVLLQEGVEIYSLLDLDLQIFTSARKKGDIDEKQLRLVQEFLRDPDRFMKEFLVKNPDFIRRQILIGGKAKERANLAIEKGFADLYPHTAPPCGGTNS